MNTITWLHISDLQFRDLQYYDTDVVLHALLRDVAERIQVDGLCPDFVAVSGDVAFSGKASEYNLAKPFFDDLLSTVGLGKERLLVVPGNHDVDRRSISRGAQAIGDSLMDRSSANAVLDTPEDRRLMFARFAGYASFLNDYLAGHLSFDDECYFYVHSLDLAGLRVAFLGLNSAWTAASDQDKAKGLLIGEHQARAALDQAAGADLKIALLHHPLDWLREFDQNDSAALLLDHCDFILHGHLHQTTVTQLISPEATAMVLACGVCYKTREFPNMYNWVRLDLTSETGIVYLRRYSDARGGFWTKDALTYRNVHDGMYRFNFTGQASAMPTAIPGPAHPDKYRNSTVASGRNVATVGNSNIAITGDVHGGLTIITSDGQTPNPAPETTGAEDTSGYDLGAVRDLLLVALDADDLRQLCFYSANVELRRIVYEFSPADGPMSMVEKTIQHCLKRGSLPDLLAEIKRVNPQQYARFEGRLQG